MKSDKGSGVGLRNVHERIQLYFGADYGVKVESELEEGTVVKNLDSSHIGRGIGRSSDG